MRTLAVIAITVALGALALGQVAVTDQAGREVTLPAEVDRVVSIFGVATPYIYSLAEPDVVVAARYLGVPDHPLSRSLMTRLDPTYEEKALPGEVNAETVAAYRPQLVFGGLKHTKDAELLALLGIPTILLGAETFDAVREATLLVGQALGRMNKAGQLVAFFDQILKEAAKATEEVGVRSKVLVLGTEPLRVASGDMYQSRMVELAGGIPVTSELPGSWLNVDIEMILLWDPEVIIIVPYSPVSPEDLLSNPVWQGVKATKDKRVYKMPQLLFAWDTPIPESVLGVLWMAEVLHQGTVSTPLSEAFSQFYRDFYRIDLTEEELSVILSEP